METSTTERGGNVILVNGHHYIERKDRRGRDGSRTWRCREFVKFKCPATVKTLNGQVMEGKGNDRHSHSGDPLIPMIRKIQSDVRTKAATSMDTTRSIVSSALEDVPMDVLLRLPKRSTLDDNVRGKRRASNPVEPNPHTRVFDIPEEFQDVVLFDSGSEDPKRFLILGKLELLDVLEGADLWLGDGTFDVSPDMFYQLYTIHCKIGVNYPPCVYFLLPDKQQVTYVRAFEELKNLIFQASPITILVDFEVAPSNAFRSVFEGCRIKGCLFHQGQNLNKKVNQLGLKRSYESNVEFNMAVKSLLALSFVPEEEVLQRFQDILAKFRDLMARFPELERVDELCYYFELTYIRGMDMGENRERADARFPPAMWNHFRDPENKLPRTTNAVEGYHNALNSLFLAKHPSLWKVLSGLKKDMALHRKTWADSQVVNNKCSQ